MWGFVEAWVHPVLTRAAAGLEGALGASATRPTRGGKDGRARFSLCLDPGRYPESDIACREKCRSTGAPWCCPAAGREGREQQPQLGAQGGGFRPTQLLGLRREAPISLGSPQQWGSWRHSRATSSLEGARVFMGTGHRARRGSPAPGRVAVPAVQGTLPGSWRSPKCHGTRSSALRGICVLLPPITELERSGEAEGIESGFGRDPGAGIPLHPAE